MSFLFYIYYLYCFAKYIQILTHGFKLLQHYLCFLIKLKNVIFVLILYIVPYTIFIVPYHIRL